MIQIREESREDVGIQSREGVLIQSRKGVVIQSSEDSREVVLI